MIIPSFGHPLSWRVRQTDRSHSPREIDYGLPVINSHRQPSYGAGMLRALVPPEGKIFITR